MSTTVTKPELHKVFTTSFTELERWLETYANQGFRLHMIWPAYGSNVNVVMVKRWTSPVSAQASESAKTRKPTS